MVMLLHRKEGFISFNKIGGILFADFKKGITLTSLSGRVVLAIHLRTVQIGICFALTNVVIYRFN